MAGALARMNSNVRPAHVLVISAGGSFPFCFSVILSSGVGLLGGVQLVTGQKDRAT